MREACVADFREASRRRLPRVLFDYIDGGAYAEETLAANVADLREVPGVSDETARRIYDFFHDSAR